MREMSEEMRNKMAGLLPVNSDFIVKFTPKEYDDIDADFRPIFSLKPWNAGQLKVLASIGNDETKAINMIASQITNIENLYNLSSGEVIDYSVNPKEVTLSIPKKILLSILGELTRISGI